MRLIHRWIGVFTVAAVTSGATPIGDTIAVPSGTHAYVLQAPDGCFAPRIGARRDLRIRRVTTAPGIDIVFTSASPHDATTFFFDNPLPAASGSYTLTVENPLDQPITMHVQAVSCH